MTDYYSVIATAVLVGSWAALVSARRELGPNSRPAKSPISANAVAPLVALATLPGSQRSVSSHLWRATSQLIVALAPPRSRHKQAFALRCRSRQSTHRVLQRSKVAGSDEAAPYTHTTTARSARLAPGGSSRSSAPSCNRAGLRSPSIASRNTARASSSGFTVLLPNNLSVNHASSKAVSKSTSV